MRVFQEVEMIGNTGSAHGERFTDFADGQILVLEHFEDAAAGWIAQSFE
jgi:hypothetical protein